MPNSSESNSASVTGHGANSSSPDTDTHSRSKQNVSTDVLAGVPLSTDIEQNGHVRKPQKSDLENLVQEAQQKHEENMLEKNKGMLGRFFGSLTFAPTNIAGAILVVLVLASVFHHFRCSGVDLSQWEKEFIFPILTLTLGYVFGNKHSG
jgi:hypothetical protein